MILLTASLLYWRVSRFECKSEAVRNVRAFQVDSRGIESACVCVCGHLAAGEGRDDAG